MFSYFNICQILQLPSSARILILGEDISDMYNDFSKYFNNIIYIDSFKPECNHDLFDLIIVNDINLLSVKRVKHVLFKLTSSLTNNGFLVLFINNNYSWKQNLSRILKQKKNFQCFRCFRHFEEYIKILKELEFLHFTTLKTTMTSSDFEELSPTISKPSNVRLCSPNFRVISNYLLFASKYSSIPFFDYMPNLLHKLIGYEKILKSGLRLTLIEFRKRGALVQIYEDIFNNFGVILRSSTSDHITKILKKNTTKLTELLSNNLPESISGKIPKQYGELKFGDSILFVEEKMKGHPAWHFKSAGVLEQKIFHNAIKFIIDLEKSTKRRVKIDANVFEKIYRSDFKDIYTQNFIDLEFQKLYEQIVAKILSRIMQRKWFVVWGHGDFAYGNILVDKYNGDICGVIDWDAARKWAIPGVELLNLMFTRHMIVHNTNYMDALDFIGKKCLQSGGVYWAGYGEYEKELEITSANIGIIVATLCLSWVSSGARYKEEFIDSRKNSIDFFRWALSNCFETNYR